MILLKAKILCLVCIATSSGCATATVPRSPAETDFQIRISRAAGDKIKGVAIAVMIKNISSQDVCLFRDHVENPASFGMMIRLKDKRGVAIRRRSLDLIEEPIEGIVRLKAGDQLVGSYWLEERFKIPAKILSQHGSMRARVSFRYFGCSNPDIPWNETTEITSKWWNI